MSATPNHLSIDILLDYWLDDTDAATADVVDEHLMQCDACGKVLDGLIALGDSVRVAFRAGAVSAVTSDAFVRRLAGQGLKVREYRLPHNGSVNCTVAPEDELLVAHLEAPLQGIERLDALAQLSIEPGVQHKLEDIPFDPQVGEVLYVSKLAEIRNLPAHTMEITLLAVASGRTREVGRYTFRHRPWPGH
ncbi:MAG: hypothetical protein EHM83_05645 [Burkholderiales bacterium]|nr:MAG: hypothetical protein EHM83_05645 [Burkholderiales bacterium]